MQWSGNSKTMRARDIPSGLSRWLGSRVRCVLGQGAKASSSATAAWVPGHDGSSLKINLCCGPVKLSDYINIDVQPSADIVLNLDKSLLPFPENSAQVVVCISAINYFTRERSLAIIRDVHRVLRPGGIVRFGVQDLRVLATRYVEDDRAFFNQRTSDGRIRFPGETMADRINEWFYGFDNGLGNCGKYVYDFETLQLLFRRAGFVEIEAKAYRESRLPDVEQIDNRPDQMFFLEATKGTVAYFEQQARGLWDAGHRLRGWQFWLHALDLDPSSEASIAFVLPVLRANRRPQSALGLFDRMTDLDRPTLSAGALREQVQADLRGRELAPEAQSARHAELDALGRRRNTVASDEEHLRQCMQWLSHARKMNDDGGVPLQFDLMRQKWDISFPETTGYIIPTFLAYAKAGGGSDFVQAAKQMGEWEIAIQAVNGGAGEPIGWYNRPRVFNTGMVLLGWIALFRATNDDRYLNAAHDAAHFLMRYLDEDGAWRQYTFRNAPRAYKARVVWALLELYALTRYKPYRNASRHALNWILRQAHSNGWFENNSMTRDNGRVWTHPIGYTLGSLHEIYRLGLVGQQQQILKTLVAAADSITRVYMGQMESRNALRYRGLPGWFDSRWRSSAPWSCVTGNIQLEFFLRRLACQVDKPDYLSVADALMAETKALHLVDGISDENLRGGLLGSDPVGGGYHRYSIPNWGVKFFADSLLQRVAPAEKLFCLG